MLTGAAKIGYMLAISGLILFVRPAVAMLFESVDAFDVAHLVVGTILFVAGLPFMWRNAGTLRLAWRSLWAQSLSSRKDRVALFFLIIPGIHALPVLVAGIWSPENATLSLPLLVMALAALVLGWVLVLSDLWQTRSPQD
jgi:hypothetical protein